MISASAQAEAKRILDGAARRLLAARLDGDAVGAAPWGDGDPLDDGTDERTPLLEGEQIPVPRANGDGGNRGRL